MWLFQSHCGSQFGLDAYHKVVKEIFGNLRSVLFHNVHEAFSCIKIKLNTFIKLRCCNCIIILKGFSFDYNHGVSLNDWFHFAESNATVNLRQQILKVEAGVDDESTLALAGISVVGKGRSGLWVASITADYLTVEKNIVV